MAYFLVAFPQAAGVASLPGGETLEQRAASTMPKLLDAFGHLAKSSNTLIIPSNASDIASFVSTAMTVLDKTRQTQVAAKGS